MEQTEVGVNFADHPFSEFLICLQGLPQEDISRFAVNAIKEMVSAGHSFDGGYGYDQLTLDGVEGLIGQTSNTEPQGQGTVWIANPEIKMEQAINVRSFSPDSTFPNDDQSLFGDLGDDGFTKNRRTRNEDRLIQTPCDYTRNDSQKDLLTIVLSSVPHGYEPQPTNLRSDQIDFFGSDLDLEFGFSGNKNENAAADTQDDLFTASALDPCCFPAQRVPLPQYADEVFFPTDQDTPAEETFKSPPPIQDSKILVKMESDDSDEVDPRKERRKEQNRRAARKCRDRKKVSFDNMCKALDDANKVNVQYKQTIEKLKAHVRLLTAEIQQHRVHCGLQLPTRRNEQH